MNILKKIDRVVCKAEAGTACVLLVVIVLVGAAQIFPIEAFTSLPESAIAIAVLIKFPQRVSPFTVYTFCCIAIPRIKFPAVFNGSPNAREAARSITS